MTRKQFNECVHLYGDRVFGFALKNLGDEADARDIVQEAFEKMWRKHERVEFEKSRSYLFTTAYHCIIDHVRKVKRMDFEAPEEKGSMREEEQQDNRQWIEEGLRRLGDQERSLIMLRDYEGYSYEELTELTGLSLSQVKVYLFRARKKFRDWMIDLNKVNQVI